MHLKSLFTVLFSGIGLTAFAQTDAAHYCSAAKQNHHPATAHKGTIADAGEDNYDVKYVKLDLNLTNANSALSGNALIRVLTTTSISEQVLELTADLTIDSIKVNNQSRTFTRTGDVVKIALAATVPANTALATQFFYHGTVVSAGQFFDRGIRNVFSTAALRNYTFTLGEAYEAKDWWPCKQALQDKIDSSDVWVTVPDTLRVGSNGLLQNITTITGNKKRYEWQSRNPIDYYLISASVGKYDEYAYYMHFNNSTDSMLVQSYIYPNTLTVRKPVLDSVALMINYFSDLFGRYPFWKEKYGHSQAPLSGGEEHQTMTTLGIWTDNVVPHELSHQWFGDHVTCASWKDIWLNEGFASYAEYLHVAHFNGPIAAHDKILQVHFNAMYDNQFSTTPTPTGAVYVDDTTQESRIFSSRLTYNKGSAIIHTLRFEANNDTLFFNTLKLYQQQFGNSTATTEQFKNMVAQQYGRNMDTFFNQWIYASGWPVFNTTWNQKNGTVFVHLDQTATGDYTAHKYSTPIEIKFSSASGDTTIRFQTNDNATDFSFAWPYSVVGLTIDPSEWLLKGTGTITRDNSLDVGATIISAGNIYPNPVHDFLTITNADRIQLTDITGKLLIDQSGTNKVDVRSLAPGTYLYRTLRSGKIVGEGKLVKE